jgi:hypothetical protein
MSTKTVTPHDQRSPRERVAAALAQLARDVGVVGCEVAAKLPAGTNGVITVDDFVESARIAGLKRGMGKAAVELLLVLSRQYLQKQFGARSMLSHAEVKKAFAPV